MHGKLGAAVPPMARFHAALTVAEARSQLAFPQELVLQQRPATVSLVAFCNPVFQEARGAFSKLALSVTSEVSRSITTPFGFFGVHDWPASMLS